MQTLHREVLEETGWTIRDARLIGLAHFQHLAPKPNHKRYPYPDFLHLVYAESRIVRNMLSLLQQIGVLPA
jgi:8-oxo-dGTP pyrophosphatase MutT (NUDIX family)